MRLTVPSAPLVTQMLPAPAAIPAGPEPTGTLPATWPVARSSEPTLSAAITRGEPVPPPASASAAVTAAASSTAPAANTGRDQSRRAQPQAGLDRAHGAGA
jgi:hypothetical protein